MFTYIWYYIQFLKWFSSAHHAALYSTGLSVRYQLSHHRAEFSKVDLPFSFHVDFINKLFPHLVVNVIAASKGGLNLASINRAIPIFVEQRERSLQLILRQQAILVNRSDHPFREFDFTVAVNVDFSENRVYLINCFLSVGLETS